MVQVSAPEALSKLRKGNAKYQQAKRTYLDISQEARDKLKYRQYPYAVVVACSDSRVVPEKIFMTGLGDIFVIQVAGNVVGEIELGSIEYAVHHLNTKLVMILGHSGCGAVSAAIKGHGDGDHSIGMITDSIKEAINGETDPDRASVLNMMKGLRTLYDSNVIADGIEDGVRVVCGYYHVNTGVVKFLSKRSIKRRIPDHSHDAYIDDGAEEEIPGKK